MQQGAMGWNRTPGRCGKDLKTWDLCVFVFLTDVCTVEITNKVIGMVLVV